MDLNEFIALAASRPSDILELTVQVKSYQRKINGKMTNVKAGQRAGGGSAKPDDKDKPKVDAVLAARVPAKELTPVQRYLVKQRSDAYKDIVQRHKKLRGTQTDEYSQARDVLLATSHYYDSLVDNTFSYEDRETLRLNMEMYRLDLKNTMREKLRLQAATQRNAQNELPAVW